VLPGNFLLPSKKSPIFNRLPEYLEKPSDLTFSKFPGLSV
jgi:hypothetical protein